MRDTDFANRDYVFSEAERKINQTLKKYKSNVLDERPLYEILGLQKLKDSKCLIKLDLTNKSERTKQRWKMYDRKAI